MVVPSVLTLRVFNPSICTTTTEGLPRFPSTCRLGQWFKLLYHVKVDVSLNGRIALTALFYWYYFNAVDKCEAPWLMHRLLWAIPWPASAVPTDATTAVRALGTVFDGTIFIRHALRPLADACMYIVPNVDLLLLYLCRSARGCWGCCSFRCHCKGAPVHLQRSSCAPAKELLCTSLFISPSRTGDCPPDVYPLYMGPRGAGYIKVSSRIRHRQRRWGCYCEYRMCLAGQPLGRVPVWECQLC